MISGAVTPSATNYKSLEMRMDSNSLAPMAKKLHDLVENGGETPVLLLHLVNTYRRLGDIEKARSTFKKLCGYDEYANLTLADIAAIPCGLTTNGQSVAPVVVQDGVLSEEQISELYDEACAQSDQYRMAYAGQKRNPNPERRTTHVFHNFSSQRAFLQDYITSQLPALCQALGVDEFAPHNIELKMSNHVDGGHFQTHADNSSVMGPSGRAISFLFYFSSPECHFSKGDLVLFDTDLATESFNEISFTRIVPLRNRFVAFPSWYYHCAMPVSLSPNLFEHGRMAVAGHIQFANRVEV